MAANCTSIDPLVTPYVDGALPDVDRQRVDEHLRVCPPCRERVVVEEAVRQLVLARKTTLTAAHAPGSLRVRCASLAARTAVGAVNGTETGPATRARVFRRARLWPLAIAASLALVVSGAFSVSGHRQLGKEFLAVELAADHIKCFGIDNLLGTHDSPAVVETAMLSGFDWRMHLSEPGNDPRDPRLELVGSRQCLYARGRMAHIMYRFQGRPVSIFMLPGTTRANLVVEALGHKAAAWSAGDRSFVLVARGSREEIAQLAAYAKASFR